jgi:hypothetical protein
MLAFVPASPTGIPRVHVVCNRSANTRNMHFSNLRASSTSTVEIDLAAAARNPCLWPTPDIDYVGTITIDVAARTVSFQGSVDEFPAFEMYSSVDGGPAKSLFLRSPELGKNPWNLIGGPNVSVSGSAQF